MRSESLGTILCSGRGGWIFPFGHQNWVREYQEILWWITWEPNISLLTPFSQCNSSILWDGSGHLGLGIYKSSGHQKATGVNGPNLHWTHHCSVAVPLPLLLPLAAWGWLVPYDQMMEEVLICLVPPNACNKFWWSRTKIWPWGGSSTQWACFGQCFDKIVGSTSHQETFQKQEATTRGEAWHIL